MFHSHTVLTASPLIPSLMLQAGYNPSIPIHRTASPQIRARAGFRSGTVLLGIRAILRSQGYA